MVLFFELLGVNATIEHKRAGFMRMRVYGTNLPREIHRLCKGLVEKNYTALIYT